MKIRSMKKKAALLAMAVAMSFGAGSALAVRQGSEYKISDCSDLGYRRLMCGEQICRAEEKCEWVWDGWLPEYVCRTEAVCP